MIRRKINAKVNNTEKNKRKKLKKNNSLKNKKIKVVKNIAQSVNT